MDNSNSLVAGERIEVEIDESNGTGLYKSKVDQVIDEKTIIITRPIGRGRYAYITEGQTLRVVFTRKDTAYYYNTTVIERVRSQESVLVKLQIISDMLKLQRRNYFRLEIVLPLTVVITQFDTGGIKKSVKNFYTSDISGGGIKIMSDYKIDEGTELDIYISIPGIGDKPIKGRVVRSIVSYKNKDAYDMGIEFTDIESRIRQTIIQYIFSKQRELLKRGFK